MTSAADRIEALDREVHARRRIDAEVGQLVELARGGCTWSTLRAVAVEVLDRLDDVERVELLLMAVELYRERGEANLRGEA